ncbi:MerR family transcriptional regulator [Azospirillum argentinense]
MLELVQINRTDAAAVLGIPETTLKGWIDKGLYPNKSQGRGRPLSFDLRDLMTAKAVHVLADHGLSVSVAIRATAAFSVYGCFVHGGENPEYIITRNREGNWFPSYGTGDVLRISLMLKTIHDELVCRLVERLKDTGEERLNGWVRGYIAGARASRPEFFVAGLDLADFQG